MRCWDKFDCVVCFVVRGEAVFGVVVRRCFLFCSAFVLLGVFVVGGKVFIFGGSDREDERQTIVIILPCIYAIYRNTRRLTV
jgi:hypothetical protein